MSLKLIATINNTSGLRHFFQRQFTCLRHFFLIIIPYSESSAHHIQFPSVFHPRGLLLQVLKIMKKQRKFFFHMYHIKTAISKEKPTLPQSRRDCGMKTCGCKSTTDWISWLRWMKGICSFVTWFNTMAEQTFSPCPDYRPLTLSKIETTAFIQDRSGHRDSSIFRGILNISPYPSMNNMLPLSDLTLPGTLAQSQGATVDITSPFCIPSSFLASQLELLTSMFNVQLFSV